MIYCSFKTRIRGGERPSGGKSTNQERRRGRRPGVQAADWVRNYRDSQAGPRGSHAPRAGDPFRLSRKPELDVAVERTGSRGTRSGAAGQGHRPSALLESRQPALLSRSLSPQSAVWTPPWRGLLSGAPLQERVRSVSALGGGEEDGEGLSGSVVW